MIVELQKLFTLMIGSKEKFVSPKLFVDCIVNEKGNKIFEFGVQQDFFEQNCNFIERVCDGLLDDELSLMQTQAGFQSLTNPMARQHYECEIITANQHNETTEFWCAIQLQPKNNNLYKSIQSYFKSYQEEKSKFQKTGVKRFSENMFFLLQRQDYNQQQKTFVKDTSNFFHVEKIYLDFIDQQYGDAEKSQFDNFIQELTSDLDRNIDKDKERQNWENMDIYRSFEVVHKYYQSQKIKTQEMIKTEQELLNTKIKLERNRGSIYDIWQKLVQNFDEKILAYCRPRIPYYLHAVVIHEGGNNNGHYFLLIKQLDSPIWWKFSDSQVSKVEYKEIQEQILRYSYLYVFISENQIASLRKNNILSQVSSGQDSCYKNWLKAAHNQYLKEKNEQFEKELRDQNPTFRP